MHHTITRSRRFALLGAMLLAGFTAAGAQGTAGLQAAVAQSGGRVIVTLKSTRTSGNNPAIMAPGSPAVSADEMQQISSHLGTSFAATILKSLPATSMVVATIQPTQLSALLADPNVAAVEADRVWFAADVPVKGVPSPPTQPMVDRWAAYRGSARVDQTPWGVSQVTAPTVWASGNKGDGIKVGILDSGGDASHPDLAYAGGYDAVNQNTINWNDDVGSCNGHGTHIAGTIAAKDDGNGIVGVAPHVQLYAMKVFQDVGGQCGAYTSSQIAGINWAVTQGIRLVNVSIAGTVSFAYDAAIQAAAASGTYVFAAAGNSGGALTYPGSSAYAFGIGALDETNARASFSDFGPELDFAAPGVNIYSTMPGGTYGYKAGTSMATPHAVGVAALVLANNPSLSFDQLRQKLIDGALDLETAGFDNNTGYGLVRAANSIAGGGGSPPPIAMTISPVSRSVSVQSGTAAPGDNATVTLSGTGASSATWTATKRHNWTTLTTSSGTGSGTVAWTRAAAGLGFGTWVDTITVVSTGATGSPTFIIDSLTITVPPPTVTLAVSPVSRLTTVQQGGTAPAANATVTLSGTGGGTAFWSATKRKSWTTLTTASGTGSGAVAWTRNASGLGVGTWVDTITVTSSGATGSPGIILDSIVVTAAPPPLAIAVSPGSRNVVVQQGGSAPSDNATVTLSGTGASSATWSATKRKSWTTLTTASGTSSGAVAWTRNASGLGVGTWVDTITVSSAGATGSPSVVYDSLVITAAPPPLAISVSPSSRNVSVPQGGSAPGDNAGVTLSGTGASSATWSATKRKSWTTLTTASGTGSGAVAWTRNASGLGVGTWVDTITVSSIGATGSPSVVYDTLVITASAVPLALALSPLSRHATALQGSATVNDSVAVTLTGTGASSAVWWGSHRRTYSVVTSGNGSGGGVGSGVLSWSRNTTGLAPGNYVDTLGVAVAGGSGLTAFVVDTLTITASSAPLALSVAPTSRSVSVQQGTAAPGDAATVTLTGTGASSAVWWGSHRKPWTTITSGGGSGGGVGSGSLTWTRDISGMAPGVYVDTLGVAVAGGSGLTAVVYDTITIAGSAAPLVLSVSPSSRVTTVQVGTSAPGDAGLVTLTGTGASTAPWSATRLRSWTTLTTSSGTGSGNVSWSRNASTLAAGTYVDTITVVAAGAQGSPARIVDTLIVTAAPPPLVLAVSPAFRTVSVVQGGGSTDNATVSLTGTGASSATWTATRRKSWTTLTTGSGTGNGVVAWSRSSAGLGVGVYVDTITVSAAGATGSPAMVFDTMRVTATPVPVTVAVSPTSRTATVVEAGSAPGDNAFVTLAGDNAAGTTWTATKKRAWTVLLSAGGTGSGTLSWSRNAAGLVAGIYVDTITVAISGGSARVIDTLKVTSGTTVATNPKGKKSRFLLQNGAAQIVSPIVDSAQVLGQVAIGQSDVWSALSSSSALQLTTATGHLNEWVRWQRFPAQVSAGLHIDTVQVALQASPLVTTIFVDTLEVVSVAAPTPNAAVDDLFRPGAISDDQRALLDRDGNNNGRYDLGDFLAWVDHNHIRLSAAIMTRVQGLMKVQSAPVAKPAGGGGSLPTP